jgi:hypothetical protein
MERKETRPRGAHVQSVKKQIERWRRTRTKLSPMPEPLWAAAVEVARARGVYGAARALGLCYGSLRTRAERQGVPRRRPGAKRAARPAPTFVELRAAPFETASPAGVVVEVTGSTGQKLIVRCRGDEVDWSALIRECWQGET